MTLQNSISWIQTKIALLDGIRSAPEYPPERSGAFPFSVAYMGGGEYVFGPGGLVLDGLHSIVVELHVARKDLPRAIETAAPYVESIPNAIASDLTLGGYAELFSNITYEFAPDMMWDTVETIGFRFIVEGIVMKGCQ